MKKKDALVLCIVFFLWGCIKDKVTNNNSIDYYNLKSLSQTVPIKLSDLGCFDIEYIKLQTDSNALIQNIHKLLCLDDYFIVCDDRNKILKFGFNGNFITQIGNVGKAPAEYIYCNDISIRNSDKTIYVLSGFENRIYVYSEDGLFQRTIPCPQKTMSFFVLRRTCYAAAPTLMGLLKIHLT